MADIFWSGGGGDGDVTDTANWTGGVVPGNSDRAVFNSTDYDIFGTFTNRPGDILVTRGWRGANFGTAGSPVVVPTGTVASILVALNENVRSFQLNVVGTATLIEVEGTANAPVIFSGGTITTLTYSMSGIVKVANGMVLTNGYIGEGCQAILEPASTGLTLLDVARNARVYTQRALANSGTMKVDGYVEFQGSAAAGLAMGTTTLVDIFGNGWVRYAARPPASGSTFINVEVRPGGRFDPIGAGFDFTIDSLRRWKGSTVQKSVPGVVVTASAEILRGAIDDNSVPATS